jgi:transcriptional regulator with XRE-family HTH domain
MSNFATSLRDAREREHMTQGQLAERLGISQQAVGRWEAGGSIPRTAHLTAILDMFKHQPGFVEAFGAAIAQDNALPLVPHHTKPVHSMANPTQVMREALRDLLPEYPERVGQPAAPNISPRTLDYLSSTLAVRIAQARPMGSDPSRLAPVRTEIYFLALLLAKSTHPELRPLCIYLVHPVLSAPRELQSAMAEAQALGIEFILASSLADVAEYIRITERGEMPPPVHINTEEHDPLE